MPAGSDPAAVADAVSTAASAAVRPPRRTIEIALVHGERWWGGAVADGTLMPFGSAVHHRDLGVNAGDAEDPSAGANQSAPLLLSDRGRYVWSAEPFAFTVTRGRLSLQGMDVEIGAGTTPSLAGAFRAAAARHFPPSGRAPDAALFRGPQYNTWMELPYTPTQQGVLDYVRGLLDAGFPPGVVMIDDRWSQDYGVWRFDPVAFPDPSAMIDRLHDWGCAVMLWVVPFVSPDSATRRALQSRGLLVRRPDGRVAVRNWWNGDSAILDLTHPEAIAWLTGELRDLQQRHGVDGFKFDAGDLRHYRADDVSFAMAGPTGHCQAWAELGSSFPLNEFRACWKMGGRPLAQRLHDKPATWDGHGLASLIPESIAQGLIGHPFGCPDMIGGGELALATAGVDQELFVRYAQLAALHPMMQFSLDPTRVLDAAHLSAVRDSVALRRSLLPDLLAMVDDAARTGEPILRPLNYDRSAEPWIADQFTLGGRILVAPVVRPAATSRRVRFPEGTWIAPDGTRIQGPDERDVPVTLTTLLWYRRATPEQ
ncbi:glycoside hydrolase family 31 protein [Nakamurella sp.]|uniref:glycoside hydrolase family 31 protein n=1 Tax=Nakamurella sp. TaxID=1869182 RepID=UPI003B3A3B5F